MMQILIYPCLLKSRIPQNIELKVKTFHDNAKILEMNDLKLKTNF